MRFSCLCGLLACFAGFLCLATRVVVAQATSQSSGQADSTKYVGVEVCQGCHEDLYTSFRKSARKATPKNKTAATRGCEGCHRPGAEHVEAGGDSRKIWRFSDAKPETVPERCTRCHEANLGAAHSKPHLSCLTCHSVHHPRSAEVTAHQVGNPAMSWLSQLAKLMSAPVPAGKGLG